VLRSGFPLARRFFGYERLKQSYSRARRSYRRPRNGIPAELSRERRHHAHIRAQQVCAEQREWFDRTPGGRKARAALGTHVADVDRLHSLQERSIEDGRAAIEQCRQARHTLRTGAKAFVMVGRVVNLDAPINRKGQLARRGRIMDSET
jgi:hypothetical protein